SAITIGATQFEVRDTITREPDRIADGILFGPRILMSEAALKATGLIRPGSLITWRYRVKLAGDATRSEVRKIVRQARTEFAATGWRVRSRNNAAPGTGQFIERLSYFMTLVGLTALIVGGAGIANATSAFIDRRVMTVAILKCLGASARTVEGIYLTEILIVTLLAIAI